LCSSFFDDIFIYSPDFATHLHHIRLIFQLLARDQWYLKLSKCSFAQRQILYLGHTISEAGVGTDPSKLTAIQQWPVPASTKEL